MTTVREARLTDVLKLLACAWRLIAAFATGNETALANVEADIDAARKEWRG